MKSNHQVMSKIFLLFCAALVVAAHPCSFSVRHGEAQTLLEIRGSMSFKVAKGRLSFKIGEVANFGTSSIPSGKLELALWLSRKPYDGAQAPDGSKLASCSFEGIPGGETIANASCQAKLRFISRGKYYIIITLSEVDPTTNTPLFRDSFTFSKRLKF